MPTIEQLFLDAPTNPGQYNRVPPNVLTRYIEGVDLAYAKTGLDPKDTLSDFCPGITDDTGEFQVTLRRPYGSLAARTVFIAYDTEQLHIVRGDVSDLNGRANDIKFQALSDGAANPYEFFFSKASWKALGDLVLLSAQNDRFAPVEKQLAIRRFGVA